MPEWLVRRLAHPKRLSYERSRPSLVHWPRRAALGDINYRSSPWPQLPRIDCSRGRIATDLSRMFIDLWLLKCDDVKKIRPRAALTTIGF